MAGADGDTGTHLFDLTLGHAGGEHGCDRHGRGFGVLGLGAAWWGVVQVDDGDQEGRGGWGGVHPAQWQVEVQGAGCSCLVQDGVCLFAGLGDERAVGVFGHGVEGSVEFAVEFLGACLGAGVQPQPARGQDQGVAGGLLWAQVSHLRVGAGSWRGCGCRRRL